MVLRYKLMSNTAYQDEVIILKVKDWQTAIGACGISAFPMSSRVVHKMGLKEDPQNFLLMHACLLYTSAACFVL